MPSKCVFAEYEDVVMRAGGLLNLITIVQEYEDYEMLNLDEIACIERIFPDMKKPQQRIADDLLFCGD